MSPFEKKFHNDMVNIYVTAKQELKYNATRFLQLIMSAYSNLVLQRDKAVIISICDLPIQRV